jgi:hypothetical protein
MPEPLKVDVAYTADHRWVAEIEPDFDQPFEQGSLLELVNSIRKAWAGETLLFIVDADSIQNLSAAEAEFHAAAHVKGVTIRKSRKSPEGDVAEA